MEGVDRAVRRLIGKQDNQNRFAIYKLKTAWPEIVGATNAQHCGPVKLDRRVLYVEVDSSSWSSQFVFLKQNFIQKINAFLCSEYVKDMKFSLGRGFKYRKLHHPGRKLPARALVLPELSPEEQEEIRRNISSIRSDILREKIFAIECKKRAREKLYEAGKIARCKVCGAYLDPGEKACGVCARKRREEQEKAVSVLLRQDPWLSWSDLSKMVKCDKIIFDAVRSDLCAYYYERVRRGFADEREKNTAVQLKTGKPLSQTGPQEYENVLGFLQKRKKDNVRSFR